MMFGVAHLIARDPKEPCIGEVESEPSSQGDGRMQKAPRTSFWQRFGIARLFRGAPPARTQTDNAKKRKGPLGCLLEGSK